MVFPIYLFRSCLKKTRRVEGLVLAFLVDQLLGVCKADKRRWKGRYCGETLCFSIRLDYLMSTIGKRALRLRFLVCLLYFIALHYWRAQNLSLNVGSKPSNHRSNYQYTGGGHETVCKNSAVAPDTSFITVSALLHSTIALLSVMVPYLPCLSVLRSVLCTFYTLWEIAISRLRVATHRYLTDDKRIYTKSRWYPGFT